MRIITRTIYASALQTATMLNLEYIIEPFSSLNDALVEPAVISNLPNVITRGMEITAPYNASVDTADMFTNCFCIGNGAHRIISGPPPSIPYPDTIPHRPSDSGLFNMLPFLVRPATNDLTAIERQNYRLRRTLDIDGTLYVAYYLKRIDTASASPENTLVTIVDSLPVTVPFAPTINNLRPTVPPVGSVNNGSYLQTIATVNISFTANDVNELKAACQLLYNNENLAIISEIGIVQSVDHLVTQRYPNTGTQTATNVVETLYEVVGSQIAAHISDYYPVVYTNDGFDITIDMGAAEPLYGTL